MFWAQNPFLHYNITHSYHFLHTSLSIKESLLIPIIHHLLMEKILFTILHGYGYRAHGDLRERKFVCFTSMVLVSWVMRRRTEYTNYVPFLSFGPMHQFFLSNQIAKVSSRFVHVACLFNVPSMSKYDSAAPSVTLYV